MISEVLPIEKSNLSPEIIRLQVLPFYNLQNGEISVIKFKDTDKQRAVYRIDYKNKSYCLKKVYYDLQDLLYVYSAIEWLYRKNIRVPKLLPTIDKNRFVTYDGMFFILTPWISGEKCDFDNINHVMSSIKKLAEIHSISHDFYPIIGSSTKKGYDDYYISTLKHFEDLLRSSNEAFKHKDKFSREFISYFDFNFNLAKISLDISSSINTANLSNSLCHGDYVNKNIIFPDDLDPWIIDFDKCKTDYSAKDLSYFMRRILRRENTKWNIDLAISILKSYNDISPLTNDDFKYIISYICFPQKYWKISRDYYKNIYKCNKTAFLTLLTNITYKNESQYDFTINIIDSIKREFNVKL